MCCVDTHIAKMKERCSLKQHSAVRKGFYLTFLSHLLSPYQVSGSVLYLCSHLILIITLQSKWYALPIIYMKKPRLKKFFVSFMWKSRTGKFQVGMLGKRGVSSGCCYLVRKISTYPTEKREWGCVTSGGMRR